MNQLLNKLPKHLLQYTVKQDYNSYTAQNHAVWRYVMRLNTQSLKNKAHKSYLNGLIQTGISIEKIPSIDEMNERLAKIGWAAVAVDGFIPPNAFMEFQAHNVLVIACDIRNINHISYTPAPDIIHEAAGHAPIIANPEYAEYLRRFGEIGNKTISSAEDFKLYEAIRLLSILKEDPHTSEVEIKKAETAVIAIQNGIVELSEMAQIRNLHWWTVEYGLIGELDNPKIYGAGLLSSIGESESCLKDHVKKIPYSIEAAKQNFDITKPQPQLFVTPDFAYLSLVLEEFANKMALRKGGLKGLNKLIKSKNIGSIELSTGLQISGIFSQVIKDENNRVLYFKTNSKTALAYKDKELIAHGTGYHTDGFGSPVGKLKGINLAIEDMYPSDLEAYGIYEGKIVDLHFNGGIHVSGEIITGIRNLQGKILLISFKNCTVTYGDEVLFHPDWGIYDMAVGKRVLSAFSGPADVNSFENFKSIASEKTHKNSYSKDEIRLHDLYQIIRDNRKNNTFTIESLKNIFQKILETYPKEWLLILEIFELSNKMKDQDFNNLVLAVLKKLKTTPEFTKLIDNGVELINGN